MLACGISSGRAQSIRIPSEQAGQEIPGQMPGTPAELRPSNDSPVLLAASDAARTSNAPSGRVAPNAPSLVRDTSWPPAPQLLANDNGCSAALTGRGTTYHVGPGQKYADLQDVPWLSLRAGDVVNIHYRPEPYRSKIGLRGQGTADEPIVINGVTDANCQRPVISGENALTVRDAQQRQFFSKQYSENLGVFLIYKGPQDAYGYRPAHIHFLVAAPGMRTLTTQVNIPGDSYIDDDFAFATRDGLIVELERNVAPAGYESLGITAPFTRSVFNFVLPRAASEDEALPLTRMERVAAQG